MKAFSLVTSFQRGSHNLPTEEDCNRITRYSKELYLAGGSITGSDRNLKNILRKAGKTLQRKKARIRICCNAEENTTDI